MKISRLFQSLGLSLLCLMLAATALAERKAEWTIVDLGTLPGSQGSHPFGVNNRGDVVGSSVFPGGFSCCNHPFLWRNGAMTDITPPGTRNGQATAVNAPGTALLQMDGPNIFLWRDGAATKLPFSGVGRDINNDDAVVGSAQFGFFSRAFFYRDGVLHDLGTFGGTSSEAFGVNNGGVVVGRARMPDNAHDYAFVWADGVMQNIDSVRGFGSAAFDVNDGGVVVGAFTDASRQTFAFIWDAAGGMRKLVDLPQSIAHKINNRGDVIGTIGVSGSFLFSDGVLTRLESIPAMTAAGFTQFFPEDINERGWITGVASGPSGGKAILLIHN